MNNDVSSSSKELVALVTVDDEYVRNIITSLLDNRKGWKILFNLPSTYSSECDKETTRDDLPSMKNHRYDFHWGEYEHIDWFSPYYASQKSVVSCYYVRKGLSRKGNLAYLLEKWSTKYKDSRQRLMPKTYIFEFCSDSFDKGISNDSFSAVYRKSKFPGFGDGDEFETRDIVDDGNVWILKPSITNQANGIRLVRW